MANGRGNSVSVIDAARHEIITTIPAGERVWGLALSPDGSKLYAANSLSNTVAVIDTAAHRVIATINVGDGPWGIAIQP